MTGTSPAAVERFTPEWSQQFDSRVHAYMVAEPEGRYVRHSDYAALSSQLDAANQRAEVLGSIVQKWTDDGRNKQSVAHAQGKAEGLREAIDVCLERGDQIDTIGAMGECCAASCRNCADDIGRFALIPTDTPAKVTVQAAAQLLAALSEARKLPFYVVDMPLTASGDGPATIGFGAAKIQYEVWDTVDMTTKSTHELLSDAIPAMFRAIAGGRDE